MCILHLGLARRYDSIPWNQLGKNTTSGLDTKCERADINQDNFFCALLPGKDTALDGGSIGYCFIGVDALGGLFATKEFLEELLDFGYTSRASDKYNLPPKSAAI
jgi:hypothetical protein